MRKSEMPRASRHYIPGHVWHITHRCHKKEFLLKFAMDRQAWLDWLFNKLNFNHQTEVKGSGLRTEGGTQTRRLVIDRPRRGAGARGRKAQGFRTGD